MMKIPALLGLAVLAGSCTAYDEPNVPPETQAGLARALEGRVAGPPVPCVALRRLGGNRTVGDAIVFGGDGRRIWVNRPAGGCPSLDFGRTLVLNNVTGQVCRGDIATVVDLASGGEHGGCGLGDFIPYDRAR
jgi:hypothetical protein